MPAPPVVLGFILSTLYGALFHLIFGGSLRRLLLFLLISWVGFTVGQVVGTLTGFRAFNIGAINTLSATLGAWLALFAVHFLTFAEPSEPS